MQNKAEIWLGHVQDGTCEMHGVRLEKALMKSVTQGALIQHCDFWPLQVGKVD